MTSPEPAPPADPTSYRRPGVRLGPWLAIVLVAVSLVIGVAVGLNATRLFSDPEAVEAVQNFAANPFSPAPVRAVEEPAPPVEEIAPPPPADIAGVIARLEQVEANQARATRAAASALAAANLLEAAQSSRPFTGELAAVEPYLPASDIRPLRSLARTGAPTRAVLASDFSMAASGAIAAANQPAENAGLVDRIGYALSSVVTIRRVDYTKGQGVNAVLARAELLAHDSDLEGALRELNALPAGARRAMGPWMERAQRRVDIDQALSGIRADSIRALNESLGPA